jgi:hypothetical protein
VFSNSSLEVLELSGDDAGEYVCVVDDMGNTVSKTHRITISGENNIDSDKRGLFFLQLLRESHPVQAIFPSWLGKRSGWFVRQREVLSLGWSGEKTTSRL